MTLATVAAGKWKRGMGALLNLVILQILQNATINQKIIKREKINILGYFVIF